MKNILPKRSNTILYCRRWKDTVIFYRDKLELDIEKDAGWMIEFKITDNSYLSIANEEKASVKSSMGKGITITLEVDDSVNVYDHLLSLGIDAGEIIEYESGYRSFFIYDPEGHRLEFWSRIVQI